MPPLARQINDWMEVGRVKKHMQIRWVPQGWLIEEYEGQRPCKHWAIYLR
jgi:hypothetical protein